METGGEAIAPALTHSSVTPLNALLLSTSKTDISRISNHLSGDSCRISARVGITSHRHIYSFPTKLNRCAFHPSSCKHCQQTGQVDGRWGASPPDGRGGRKLPMGPEDCRGHMQAGGDLVRRCVLGRMKWL